MSSAGPGGHSACPGDTPGPPVARPPRFTGSATRRQPPVSTYRLQLQPGFGFSAAAAIADYLADLGVTHVYLSPILQATPGSTHGYDVVDHSLVSEELGGEAAFRAMVGRFRDLGLGVIVDIVPNHMAVPVPESLNRPLWSVLRDGTGSPFAAWFDVDWAAQDGRLLMPVLGGPVSDCLGDLKLDTGGAEPVLRYFDHVLPVRPGTARLPLTGPAGRPALPAGRLAPRRDRAELAAVLRHQLADRRPGRGSGRVRGHPRGDPPAGGRGAHRRAPGGPPRRARRPPRLPAPARGPHRRPVGLHREDPLRARGTACGLAVRRDHRLRRAGRGRRPVPGPGRGRAADRRLPAADRRARRVRRSGRGRQARGGQPGARGRGVPAGPAGRRGRAPGSGRAQRQRPGRCPGRTAHRDAGVPGLRGAR